MKQTITVQCTVPGTLEQIWKIWNAPEHIQQWYFASDDWHCPAAQNDLQPSGKFCYRMESKDGANGFDFTGSYREVLPYSLITATLDDGRHLSVSFKLNESEVTILETFEPASEDLELERNGWQAILNNFKQHASNTLKGG